MKKHTKKILGKMAGIYGQEQFAGMLYSVVATGKLTFDKYVQDLGIMLAEAIMYMEREEIAGPEYHPIAPDIQKWASQTGSVFIGDRKVQVQHPRLRGHKKEIQLKSYQALKRRETFSKEILLKSMSGLSGRKYNEVLSNAAEAFGVSSSSVSRHIVEATLSQLKQFLERRLDNFDLVALFLDTIHRGGAAFIVALGMDIKGNKQALGFWEGATENNEVCKDLFANLEQRGLNLNNKVLYITDGGKGIIKTLKDHFGKKLAHQRCTIHKDRNIQKHLPKRYRKMAHIRFLRALEMNSYSDAKAELEDFEKWLRIINESAADSLLEALEEILTLHRLKVPLALRKSLHSTNIIESMFARVRECEKNIKHYQGSKMSQRWLASVLLHCEKGFRIANGYRHLQALRESIIIFHKNVDKETA